MPVPLNKKWTILFGVWILHGVAALFQFFSIPAKSGLSLFQILIGGVLSAWIFFLLVLVISTLRESRWLLNLLRQIQRAHDVIFATVVFALIARMWAALLFDLFSAGGVLKYSAYAVRLNPLLNLMAFVFSEIIILFIVFHDWEGQKNKAQIFVRQLAVIVLVLEIIGLFIYFTGWGVIAGYKGDWSLGIPAVALMEWQVILASALSLGLIFLEAKQKFAGIKNLDAWICFVVWVAALILWLSQSVMPSSAALAPHEPNFQIYPFNDSQIYDGYAQSVMIGNGYGVNEIPQRPLYIVMLVIMHSIVGQNYDSVIILQSLLLAFFPVLLYLFGKEFFGRPVGVSIAMLAILRDITSNIAAPFTGNLSYSKLYLSEIPTAMMLILFLLIGIRWIKLGFPLFYGFMMGGILGIGILIRTQVVVAFPVLIFFALVTRPKLFLPALKSSLLGVLAIIIVISPWFARNWQMTGKLIFDNPASQTANLALRYSRVNGQRVDITQLPGESNSDYNDRMLVIAKNAFSENPFEIGKAIASAFINHSVNNILLLPFRYQLKTFSELWKPANAFWQEWHGPTSRAQIFLLQFYILLFGLGLTFAWRRLGWLGFLPLCVNLAYNLWTSIALLSGQRFMLTMDWSAYLYYMIGIFALLSGFVFMLARGRVLVSQWFEQNRFSFVEFTDQANLTQYFAAGILFFVVGASLWGVEKIFPKKYPLLPREEVVSRIISSESFIDAKFDAACFQKMLNEKNINITQGRALYPRYYEARDGEDFTDAAGYKSVNQNRIVFEMTGQINNRVVFPTEQSVDFFPTAADVTLGTDFEGKPWFALVEQGSTQRFYFSDSFDASACLYNSRP